jgi:hypothetical protein
MFGWLRNHRGGRGIAPQRPILMQINRQLPNKPNRRDRLGKRGVHQY